MEVRRVGRTLLVSDRASTLRAVDLATGKQRWVTPAADRLQLPAVANAELVASSVCGEDSRCRAEVRSIADGKLRWSAPTTGSYWLGSPPIAQALGADRPLWPASAVILETGREGERYEVRQLATGEVVARGRAGDDSLAVTGNLLLRETEKGVLSATDVTTGSEVWTREADGRTVARAPDDSFTWLGIPDGGLIMTGGHPDMDSLDARGRAARARPAHRQADRAPHARPRREWHRGGADRRAAGDRRDRHRGRDAARAGDRRLLRRPGPGRRPRVPRRVREARHRSHTDAGRLGPAGARLRDGDRAGAVVRDRRSGRELVRYAGENDYVSVRSEGERLVIYDGGRDLVVKP